MAQTKIKAGLFEGIIGNGTDGYFLMSNGDGTMTWASTITNPTITSIAYPGSATAADPAGGETITVTGTGFKTGATVTVGGTAAPAVSYVSATQITFTTPAKVAGDYDIVITNTDTGSATYINGISYNGIPTWTTAAGSLGTFASDTTISTITLQATEPDAGTITFSITNGALPTGLSLTGADIDGTTTLETADTLYTFTVTATDDESQTTPRTFTITVKKQFISTDNFTINTYTGNGSTQSIEGKIGTAADFNGSSSKIIVSGFAQPTGDVSVSMWIKFNSISSAQKEFFDWVGNASVPTIRINTYNSNDLRFSVGSGSRYISADSLSATTGVWYHIALSIDRSANAATPYFNGQALGSTISSTGSSADTQNLFIGANLDENRFSDCIIDQVRIFNKALSSSEVTTLYGESNTSTTKSTTDIFDDGSGVALYEFEEGAKDTGLLLADYTPIANRTFESSKSTSAQSTAPRDIEFSSDGTKLFFCDGSNKRIHQYTMTTAWDVSTASHNGYYDVTSQISGGAFPISVQFKSDGTKMYVSTYSASPERIYEYDLSSAWVVTSGVSYNSKFGNVTVQAWGMEFNSAGTILICSSDSASGNLCKYTLSTAWDISTISLSQQVTLASIKGIDLSPDGKQLLGAYFPSGNKTIRSYSLSTAYDITTLTQREEWDVNSIENILQTVTCKFDDSNKIDKLYFVGFQQDTIYGYDIDETADFIARYNGTPTNVSFVGTSFQPDLVITKSRSFTEKWNAFDSVRGATERIYLSDTHAEATQSNSLTSFDSNGYSIGAWTDINTNNETFVSYAFKGGGTAVSNTDGTITSTVSTNQAAGFSIVKYTGNEQSSQTIGHGLSSTPELAFIKQLDGTREWQAPLFILNSGDYLILNSTASIANDTNRWSAIDSSIITVGAQPHTNGAGSPYIGYFFHSVDGYQKIGTYTGNGTTSNTITTGFQPRFLMVKSESSQSWRVVDTIRNPSNPVTKDLRFDASTVENDWPSNGWGNIMNINSNGFEIISTDSQYNTNTQTYIYWAIA